jgi:hypothetical protein
MLLHLDDSALDFTVGASATNTIGDRRGTNAQEIGAQ